MSLIVSPPETLKGALTIPEKTLLGPGPSNVPERILKAMALPTIGHLHPEFCKVMDDCKAGVQYAFQTKVSKLKSNQNAPSGSISHPFIVKCFSLSLLFEWKHLGHFFLYLTPS